MAFKWLPGAGPARNLMPRLQPWPARSDLALDEIPHVLQVLQLSRLLIRELDVEALLQGHNRLDDVKGVRAQLRQSRGTHHLRLVHPKLLGDYVRDLLHGLWRGRRVEQHRRRPLLRAELRSAHAREREALQEGAARGCEQADREQA